MKTIKLISEAREKLGLESDNALCKYLDVSHGTVGHWREGTRMPDATQCAKIAVAIGLEPIEVIAAIESQRLKRAAENATFWNSQVKQVREFIVRRWGTCARNNQAQRLQHFYNTGIYHSGF